MSKTNVTPLSPLCLSVFCEQFSMLLGAGIGAGEAAALLAEDTAQNALHDAAEQVQKALLNGATLTESVAEGGYFPPYFQKMLATGEQTGRTEEVLHGLADYYASRAALDRRLRSAVVYPLVLLALMAAVLGVLLGGVLPVFAGIYKDFSGGMATLSTAYLREAAVIGWVALGVTVLVLLAVLCCAALLRSEGGRTRLAALAARFPLTAHAATAQALARFTQVLSLFLASGADPDTALDAAADLVENLALAAKVAACRTQMQTEQVGLCTAIYDQKLFEPLYGRMLLAGARSGNTEVVLQKLATLFAADADAETDTLVGSVEPVLSAFLTLAVGIALVAAMLPLLGILGAMA